MGIRLCLKRSFCIFQEELQGKVLQEQLSNTGAAAILGTTDGQEELAGDPQHLKQPGKRMQGHTS